MDLLEQNMKNNNRHPWEISRARSILRIVSQNANDFSYADIGSGDLYFATLLATLTKSKVYAIDTNYDNSTLDNSRLTNANNGENGNIIKSNTLNDVPNGQIDSIILMDVLEHIEDEILFLTEVLPLLKNKGQLIITVPAFQFLFSDHDLFLKHFRRYSISSLKNVLKKNKIKIEREFYFYSMLFFIRLLINLSQKVLKRKNDFEGIGNWKYSDKSLITILINSFLNLDFCFNKFLSKFKIHFVGLSICMICRKEY